MLVPNPRALSQTGNISFTVWFTKRKLLLQLTQTRTKITLDCIGNNVTMFLHKPNFLTINRYQIMVSHHRTNSVSSGRSHWMMVRISSSSINPSIPGKTGVRLQPKEIMMDIREHLRKLCDNGAVLCNNHYLLCYLAYQITFYVVEVQSYISTLLLMLPNFFVVYCLCLPITVCRCSSSSRLSYPVRCWISPLRKEKVSQIYCTDTALYYYIQQWLA